MATKPRILIGIPCLVEGRVFRAFDQAVALTCARPREEFEIINQAPYFSMSGVVPGARNRIVRQAIAIGADYIWMLDDDQPFDPGTIERAGDLDRLFARQLEAVIPLSVRRGSPFFPLIYDSVDGEGDKKWQARQHYMQDHEAGLIRVAGAGLAGLLMTTESYRKIGLDGWFEFVHSPGAIDDYAEDFPFYRKMEAANIPLYCDLDVSFGHRVSSVAFCLKQQGKWVTVLSDTEPYVAFPQPAVPDDHLRLARADELRRIERNKVWQR